jgi:hypothetical protein
MSKHQTASPPAITITDEGEGFLAPPDFTVSPPPPFVEEDGWDPAAIEAVHAEHAEGQTILVEDSDAIIWNERSFPRGRRLHIGRDVPQEAADRWIKEGRAKLQGDCTIMFFVWGPKLINGRSYENVYKMLFTLPERQAAIYLAPPRDGLRYASAVKVCDGAFQGDPATLICPPPRALPWDTTPSRPAKSSPFVRFVWTNPPLNGSLPAGSKTWECEERAVDLEFIGRGRIIDVEELSARGTHYRDEKNAKRLNQFGKIADVQY